MGEPNILEKNETMIKKFVGDKAFYRRLMVISVPIMLQMAITNFVSLLDNIMVGRVGTEQMTGVSISNQLIFIYYLAIFGGLAGAGIFTAQYFGRRDDEGVRNPFRYKIWMAAILVVAAIILFSVYGRQFIGLYLSSDTRAENSEPIMIPDSTM